MRFLCFRTCCKPKKFAVHEPTLVKENLTLDGKFNKRAGPKTNTQEERKMSIISALSRDHHSEWTDAYATSSSDSDFGSERNC